MTITARDPIEATGFPRADLSTMRAWAEAHITAEPSFRLYAPDGRVQLERWYLIPRNEVMNLYLHRFLLSDEDQALHDHPGDNRSWLLRGYYQEVTPDDTFMRVAGDVVDRKAEMPHRVQLLDEAPVLSLFQIGPVRREWGFHCPKGWTHWREFNRVTAAGNHTIKRGC
jgi:hypothetical protein